MANKEKRISVNAFERIAKDHFNDITTADWYGVEITIKRSLPLAEMFQFSKEITDLCFLESGSFIPEVMDFAIKSGILTHYANFTLPQSPEKQYQLIYGTDAVNVVLQHINEEQLQEISQAANRKIRYMCDTDIVAVRSKLNELADVFSAMGETASSIFDGVGADDVKSLLSAADESGLNEDKIVSAYVKHAKQDPSE